MNLGAGYDPELTRPMEEELTSQGFVALKTEEDVEKAIAQEGTTLVVINSVCGCAAGKLRPGVLLSLQNEKKPNHLTTAFAGVDKVATEKVRSFIEEEPSSPSIALFKDGKIVHFMPRADIENQDAEPIANDLKEVYDKYC